MIDDESKKLIKDNQVILQDLDKRIHRIEKKFVWNTIFGFLKMIVILAPIIIGIIYLTPILKDYVKIFEPIFQSLRNQLNTTAVNPQDTNFAIESFCDPQTRETLVEQLCK